jgi:hypothetical protein
MHAIPAHRTFYVKLAGVPTCLGDHCPANVGQWHIASFRCGAEFGRYQGTADIDQAAPIKLDFEYTPS